MRPLTEDEAKAKLIGPISKGSFVVVVRGRKVPHGTQGTVRWEGDGEWGPRVGLAVEDEEKLVYTALKNVDAVYPGLLPGQQPAEGWVDFHARVMRERTLPQKGHRVRHKESETEGVVFWAEGTRAGFKYDGSDIAHWAEARELLLLGEHGVPLEYTPVIPACPFTNQLIVIDPQPDLPHPFCNIRSLDPLPNGNYRALDLRGHYIATLPSEAARRLTEP